MNTYVALLRGINVGGHKRIAMQDLRQLVAGLGHSEVATYIQSGNVIFRSSASSTTDLAGELEARIGRDLGQEVTVVVRSHEDLVRVVGGNPFTALGADPASLHVTFLAREPDPGLLAELDMGEVAPDEFEVRGREIYLRCPLGYGQTKLNPALWERRLKVRTTTRNWNTVRKLLEMAGG